MVALTVTSSSPRLTSGQQTVQTSDNPQTESADSNKPWFITGPNQSSAPPEGFRIENTFHIQVLSLDKKPIPNAVAWLDDVETSRHIALSGDDGRLVIHTNQKGDSNDAHQATMFAIAPGHALQAIELNAAANSTANTPHRVALPPTSKLKLRVITSDGKPQKGAKVTPISINSLSQKPTNQGKYFPREDSGNSRTYFQARVRTPDIWNLPELKNTVLYGITNNDGVVELPQIQSSQLEFGMVEYSDHPRQIFRLPEQTPRSFHDFENGWHHTILLDSAELPIVDVQLGKVWRVEGNAIAPHKDLLKGLNINLVSLNEDGRFTRSVERLAIKEDGAFETWLAGDGDINVNLVPNSTNQIEYWPVVNRSEFKKDGSAREVEIELKPLRKVFGRVQDKVNRVGIPDVLVKFVLPGGIHTQEATTDKNGDYSLRLPEGRVRLDQVKVREGQNALIKNWEGFVKSSENDEVLYLPKIEVEMDTQ